MQAQTIAISRLKAYISLMKPGIIMGNAMTAVSGFALASKGHFNLGLFLAMLVGQSLIIACGCACNNYIDREADQKMQRTQNRSLAKGMVTPRNSIIFATLLGSVGVLLLSSCVNFMATLIALFGLVVYVFVYSFWKYRSSSATLIGSIAGAVPPMIGYAAAADQIDIQALILFAVIVFWQMPHFFAIAIYRMEDYAKASIPVLPLEKGMRTTKIQMLLYIALFTLASSLLATLGYVGKGYLIVSLCLGLIWSVLSIQGFKCKDDKLWARKMFLFSLVVVTGISATLPFYIIL